MSNQFFFETAYEQIDNSIIACLAFERVEAPNYPFLTSKRNEKICLIFRQYEVSLFIISFGSFIKWKKKVKNNCLTRKYFKLVLQLPRINLLL